jgi:diacylglycerol kinase (ATP)
MGNKLPSQPRALILYNPAAGQASNVIQSLEMAANIWRSNGWEVELRPTKAPGDATIQAHAATTIGYHVVAAAGGDGTVNEVINGLVGTKTALAVLPMGTVNIWARELGLPMDVKKAASAFLQAKLAQIDLGKAGKRHFLLMAGIGFDGAVTEVIRPKEKKLLGALAYVKQAVQLGLRFRGVSTHIRIDGKRVRGKVLMVVIGNSQLYGGVFKLTANAIVNDGLLDICVIKGRSMFEAPFRLLSIFTKRYNRDPRVEYFQGKKIQIKGKKLLAVQIDGDYLGKTPMNFEVVPGGLSVLVPKSVDKSLWI